MVGLCRLCAAVRKRDMLIPMAVDVHQKLRECFALEMCQPGDKLPKRACAICLDTLQNAYNFFKKVQESQELLTVLFDELKEESNKNSEVCMRLNEEIDAKFHSTDVVKEDSVKNTDINGKRIIVSDSIQLNVELVKGNHERDEFEEYHVMESEELMRVETLSINSERSGAKSPNQLSDSSTEVETYILEEEEDLEQEQEQIYELEPERLLKKDDKVTDSNCKSTIIEIIPSTNDDSRYSKCLQAEDNDKIQVAEWSAYSWVCYSCSETCENFFALLLHCKENHNIIDANYMKYKCADCHKICTHYNKFLNHIRFRHNPELSLRCDVCDAQHESYSQLALHRETTCAAAQSYPSIDLCSKCGKSFHNRNGTMVHARAQHTEGNSDEIKWLSCAQCDRKFKRVANLRAHEHIHSGLKEYMCEICDRKFRQKHNLEIHLYTHINDKVFECKICKKSLKTSASLEKHQQIHKDIKKFVCDYCDKEFRTKDAKLSHERIHTGEKPFKCIYCDRCFRFRSGLMGHINIHTGERPYSCQDCSRQFTNWGNMNKHMKRCHKRDSGEKSK
ncbi:zinc finger protein 267-like [Anastrepha ludens]|uniref:zinc finger protein 267-like n=1 Tax=Anastrepha ludens TaxID=28586 RepID=UPI0023AFDC22|nr:zinc finger protein 267-like [Anastrepha ludens]XP_053968709.1 zinc finger protein 267-like [Anastrepha ludens]